MEDLQLTQTAKDLLTAMLRQEIESGTGKKALEYGCGGTSLAAYLVDGLEYLASADKNDEYPAELKAASETKGIYLIPDREIEEDCYFGRFHLVYTVFGFHSLPRLVDEIMRLRRLIVKGGKMVIIDSAGDHFEETCVKQLKRCGFAKIAEEEFAVDGKPAFRLSAEK